MQTTKLPYLFFTFRCVAVALLLFSMGCDTGPQISVYKVAREDSEVRGPSASVEAVTEQIHGAIVPNGESAWFFKLRGDAELTRKFSDEFREIVEGVTFDEAGKPQWTLPEQWRESPGGGFTYAKWIEQSSGLEATVSVLSINSDWQPYIVVNVNRWRGQVSLPGQQWDAMAEELETLDSLTSNPDRPAYYVSMTGKGGQSSMGGAPFLEAMRRAEQARAAEGEDGDTSAEVSGSGDIDPSESTSEKVAAVDPAESSSSAPKPLTYVVPKGWKEVPPKNSMRKAQFEASVGEQAVEIIVSQAGGEIDQNMGMWLGQVGGEPSEESVSSIVKAAESIETESGPASIYRIVGKEHGGEKSESMLLAEIPITESYSWFVKMVGNSDAVDGLQDSFEAFVGSIDFDKPQ